MLLTVTSREGRVSRNSIFVKVIKVSVSVTSREGRVSRNIRVGNRAGRGQVTSREGRVSRNADNEVCTLRHTLP